MRWACLLLPQLAVDGVLRRQVRAGTQEAKRQSDTPDTSDASQPDPAQTIALALLTGPAQRRVLHAVTPAARALGLRPGLSLAAAQALATGFVTAQYDPDDARRWRELLAAWAYGFSSQVSLDLPHAIVLEVGHSLQLFGPWPRFQARLREELRALGFRHRIVAAPNPHAARVLANVHDGLAIGENALDNALGQLPIERAGLPREVALAFSRMGLHKLRQVFALPRDTVARRFPPTVLQHLDRLRGEDAPLTWFQPPDAFEGRMEFDHEIESSQALLFPLRRLTADLAAFLAGRDGGVQRFTLVLEHEFLAPSEVSVGLLAPERQASMLFELARGRLEQAQVPAPVRGLRLLAPELPAFVPAERDLFDARPQQAIPWTQLRERLRARLGDDAVHSLPWHHDHRPERTLSTDGAMTARKFPSPDPAAPPRPGWLLPHPMPLREPVRRVIAGPERIESGWWDDADVRRDYYLVETAQGQRAWAFRIAGEASGPFMLHGWFA
ncbi:Y-family DNA polymerase [Agrilutibacter solisilvae]|uniref:DNA polymerase Y family protein n=1 Tax=Agrilutibacter solisilvae TaxID=2763317 RepID=A0A974XXN2_9GAMM|nr:DNA polymerase Y family protein [Lysobacter solisilvae]QSX77697.1 DNA polymerase Y family protein [Lysobacter solisilvae]